MATSSTEVITPTREGARGSCYLYELDTKTVPATLVKSGVYDDTLVKTPQGWRFKTRVESVDGDALSPRLRATSGQGRVAVSARTAP